MKKKLIFIAVALILACVPETKLLKRNYVRTSYDLNTIDTILISRVYTNYYDHKVFGYRRDSLGETTGWPQILIKIKRKLGEFGIELEPYCDTSISVHKYLPKARIRKYRPNDEETIQYLNLFENKKHKDIPGCQCGNRYIAVVFHFGTERTNMNNAVNNSYFIPIDILTLGRLKIRWNKGFSQMRFIVYDCDSEEVIYNGINSRYLIPSDSITVNKHLEVLLAKYKNRSDELKLKNKDKTINE